MSNTNNYTFPRVNTTLRANTRTQSVYIENPRVPVLFATVVSNKGPYEITKVRSLTEFREIYGELSYEKQGQDVLNLYQWLGAVPFNGYAWIKRIEPAFVNSDGTAYVEDISKLARATGTISATNPSFTLTFTAKEPGEVYKHYGIELTQRTNSLSQFQSDFTITVTNEKGRVVSLVKGINSENYTRLLPTLEFFDVEGTIGEVTNTEESVFGGSTRSKRVENLELEAREGAVPSGLTENLKPSEVFKAIELYYKSPARIELEDALTYPISIILDGNYPISLKEGIIDFIKDARDDIHFMLTRAKYKETGGIVNDRLELDEMNVDELNTLLSKGMPKEGNVAIFAPDILRVKDPAIDGNGYVDVSSIYELAYKIPYNDYNYGIWVNFVGPRRGIVRGDLLHTNTLREKQDYYDQKTNYIEKTNRDQCFMLQRTTGQENTAYVQLHASRLTQYIRREVTWIARQFLFEYNDIDATTYNDCKARIKTFLNSFASIAIDMSDPYVLNIEKTDETSFRISLTNLKYKDVTEKIDLYIELN